MRENTANHLMNKGFCFIASLYTHSSFVWFCFSHCLLRVSLHRSPFTQTLWFQITCFFSRLRFAIFFFSIRSKSFVYMCTSVFFFSSLHSYIYFIFSVLIKVLPASIFYLYLLNSIDGKKAAPLLQVNSIVWVVYILFNLNFDEKKKGDTEKKSHTQFHLDSNQIKRIKNFSWMSSFLHGTQTKTLMHIYTHIHKMCATIR